MVFLNTTLPIADNSGAKFLKCFKIYKKSRRIGGSVGDTILGAIKSIFIKKNKKIKKGNLYKAIIVRSRKNKKRFLGHFLSTDSTAAVLLNNSKLPFGTRVTGPVYYELRFLKFGKIISLAKKII